MGYRTSLRGDLDIVPPITAAELDRDDNNRFTTFSYDIWACTKIHVDEIPTEVTLPDGSTVTIPVRHGVYVTTYEDDVKAYEFERCLQMIVDAFPGHEFEGTIEGEGENTDDIWRARVIDGKVVVTKAAITWPEGWE